MHCAVRCLGKCVGLQTEDISSNYSDRRKSVPEIHGTLNAKSYGDPVIY